MFSEQFKKVVTRCKKIGYDMDIMRETLASCLIARRWAVLLNLFQKISAWLSIPVVGPIVAPMLTEDIFVMRIYIRNKGKVPRV